MEKIKKAVEIGAGDSYCCELLKIQNYVEEIHVFEPNRILYRDLAAKCAAFPHIATHDCAVSDKAGTQKFCNLGYASFLRGAPSFLALSVEEGSESFWDPVTTDVPVISIADFDKGDIDFLILTACGSDMSVLRALKSRPKIIGSKRFVHNDKQRDAYDEVMKWMHENDYKPTIRERNKYDTYSCIRFDLKPKASAAKNG